MQPAFFIVIKQLRRIVVFQIFDMLGDRRLGDIQDACSPGIVSCLAKNEEGI